MSTAGCVIHGGGEENKRIETSATPPLFDWSDSEDHAASLVTPVTSLWSFCCSPTRIELHGNLASTGCFPCGLAVFKGSQSFQESVGPTSLVVCHRRLRCHRVCTSVSSGESRCCCKSEALSIEDFLPLIEPAPYSPYSPNAEGHCPRPRGSPNHKYPMCPLGSRDKKDRWPVCGCLNHVPLRSLFVPGEAWRRPSVTRYVP
jgi:hypothetical protein